MAKLNTFEISKLQKGDTGVVDLVISNSELREKKNGELFIDGYGSNMTIPQVRFKCWDNITESMYNEIFKKIGAIRIKYRCDEYNGERYLNVFQYEDITEEACDIDGLIPQCKISTENLKKYFHNVVSKIQTESYQTIINELLVDRFFEIGAALVCHHNRRGGLAEHTYQVLCAAKSLVERDKSEVYSNVNPDLLYTGCILHDIGKLREFHANCFGIIDDYSTAGKLHGHINMGVDMINECCYKLGIDKYSEEIMLLNHLILSHHGKEEWGSPVKPQTLEAIVLSCCDNLSAKADAAKAELDKIAEGEWSGKVFSLDNTRLYNHKSE
jgi:3'-5' exoribonuclease